jgi:hypothetical protein
MHPNVTLVVDGQDHGIAFGWPRSSLNRVPIPENAQSHTTSFFVSGFGRGAFRAKLLNRIRQRFSGLGVRHD